MKGKRKMNTALALRIEEALGIEEGFFITLQVFYDIMEEKRKRATATTPDLQQFRPALFWDTKLETIDWSKQKRAVIKRVIERGSLTEVKEIIRFYGKNEVKRIAYE